MFQGNNLRKVSESPVAIQTFLMELASQPARKACPVSASTCGNCAVVNNTTEGIRLAQKRCVRPFFRIIYSIKHLSSRQRGY